MKYFVFIMFKIYFSWHNKFWRSTSKIQGGITFEHTSVAMGLCL